MDFNPESPHNRSLQEASARSDEARERIARGEQRAQIEAELQRMRPPSPRRWWQFWRRQR